MESQRLALLTGASPGLTRRPCGAVVCGGPSCNHGRGYRDRPRDPPRPTLSTRQPHPRLEGFQCDWTLCGHVAPRSSFLLVTRSRFRPTGAPPRLRARPSRCRTRARAGAVVGCVPSRRRPRQVRPHRDRGAAECERESGLPGSLTRCAFALLPGPGPASFPHCFHREGERGLESGGRGT